MSLLQQIITADNRTGGWESINSKYILNVSFKSREEAEKAFEKILPNYKKIIASDTWGGKNRDHEDASKISFTHHLWVDENQKGFSLCVYFDNRIQYDKIKESFRQFFKEENIKQHVSQLNESEKKRINNIEKATHSVELDITNDFFNIDVVTDFMNVAMANQKEKNLYVDVIEKDGYSRLKAYFADEVSANNFLDIIDHKIRKPLLNLQQQDAPTSFVKNPVVREFTPAKLGLI